MFPLNWYHVVTCVHDCDGYKYHELAWDNSDIYHDVMYMCKSAHILLSRATRANGIFVLSIVLFVNIFKFCDCMIMFLLRLYGPFTAFTRLDANWNMKHFKKQTRNGGKTRTVLADNNFFVLAPVLLRRGTLTRSWGVPRGMRCGPRSCYVEVPSQDLGDTTWYAPCKNNGCIVS